MRKRKDLKLYKEALTNEVNWGDSLLGRLINSSIRRTKIGFNITKVPNLLKALRGELDNLISASLTRDTKKTYQILWLKSYLNEIQDVCSSSESEEQKMKYLLGPKSTWGSGRSRGTLWDTQDPDRGYWKEWIKQGLLINVYENLDKNQIDEEIKKLNLGLDKKDILDALSDFIDDLRENTVLSVGTQSSTTTSTPQTTNVNFPTQMSQFATNVISAVGAGSTTQNSNFGINLSNRYFIIDSVHTFSNFLLLEDVGTHSTTQSSTPQNNTPETNDIESKIKQLKELCSKVKDIKSIEGVKENDQNVKDLLDFLKRLSEEETKSISAKLKKENFNFYEEVTKLLNTYEDEKEIIENDKVKNESILPFKYFKLFEEYQTKRNIIDIFKSFKEGLEADVLFEISQAEVDKFGDLGTKEADQLVLDLSKNPDPIIRILRIYQRAHDLYFTPLIPSGRSGGKVSNSVFREYILLGKDTSGKKLDDPGYGPWAVKKIFDSWRDGVLEILEDQKYRKILANIRFVAPGAEDTFNKENKLISFDKFEKIFEAEGEKKSHGQILFDFLNDMLDKDTAADFDTARKTLIKKYFGQFGMEASSVIKRDAPIKEIPTSKDTLVEKSLYFKPTNTTTLKSENKNTTYNDCKSSVYRIELKKQIPFINNNTVKSIFIQTIKKEEYDQNKQGVLVKVLFNSGKKLIEEIISKNHVGYSDQTGPHQTTNFSMVYFGIMSKIQGNGFKLKLVKMKMQPGWEEVNIDIDADIMSISRLMIVNETKQDLPFEEKFFGQLGEPKEKPTHKENLELEVNNVTLINHLKEKTNNDQNFKEL